jgi:hypothetical protein
MGRLNHEQEQFFYSFRLDEAVPEDHPVRRIAAVPGPDSCTAANDAHVLGHFLDRLPEAERVVGDRELGTRSRARTTSGRAPDYLSL